MDPTTACNLACHGCISASLLNQGGFKRDRIKNLAKEFVEIGVKAVVLIGGGEPMAHPEFGTLVDYFHKNDIHVGVTSNGTLIDYPYGEVNLAESGLNIVDATSATASDGSIIATLNNGTAGNPTCQATVTFSNGVTNSGYGSGKQEKIYTEESPLNPISTYGITKVNAEKIALQRENCITFRLATVFGFSYRMRTDLLVNFMTLKALKDGEIKVFEPHFRRNFIHVRDVANAILFSIKNFEKIKNNTYNLGLSTANITKLDLLKKIKKYVPKLKIIINNKFKDPDQRDYFVSNRKIEKVGFKASIDLDTGIKELIKVFNIIKKEKFKNNY